jgi:NAD(P)-dependent dehydrogenase (short-subunit alcohol dehydrogenase family)
MGSVPNLAGQSQLAGRVALITGANAGIGRVTARELARLGAEVYIAGRSRARTEPVLQEIQRAQGVSKAQFLPLDLSDLQSVRACAQAFLARDRPLHLLINNAGLAAARGLTPSGFEMSFGVNHMGHFLLTQLLLGRLLESVPARIVTVASRAHRHAKGIDWDHVRQPTASLTGVKEYAESKLANILFSAELGRQLRGSGVSTYALHPGVIDTEIWRALPSPLRALNRMRGLLSAEEGAKTTLYCAVSAPVEETGLYYADCRVAMPTPIGQSSALARELWRRSEGWV